MSTSVLFFLLFLISTITSTSSKSLKVRFYKSTCPNAEKIVKKVVDKIVTQNPGLGAGLIRLHFHDCFVRGCDASVLLDSIPGQPAEKENPANFPSLRGYEVVDKAKAVIEARCPETVSCADIIAFAARDSVKKLGGINYKVESGRRDGIISLKHRPTDKNLPAPFFNIKQLRDIFKKKGLSVEEMVVLSGAHSVGISHCPAFSKRLYSFNETNPQDPSLDSGFANGLKAICANYVNGTSNHSAPLDFVTPNRLDNNYYQDVQEGKGLLTSDQSLMDSHKTAKMVNTFRRHGGVWAKKFAKAMLKIGSIEVLTGKEGQIRKNCRVVN